MSKSGKARNYVFTINFERKYQRFPELGGWKVVGEPPALLDFDQFPTWITYCVYQLEVGENGVEHFQGYLECMGQQTMTRLHSVEGLERAHFEIRRGTQERAIQYAKKDDTRVDGPWEFGVAKEQGKRSDLLEVKEKLDKKIPLRQVHEEHFGTMIRYGKALKEYKRTITKPRDFKSKVFLFVGPPGKGKSTLMKLIAKYVAGSNDGVYKAPMPKGSGQYYDDYDGQDVLILDEFDGSRMRPTEFNDICDEHECVLTVHGGAGHQMVSKYIFIGTNYLPSKWWKNRNPSQVRQTMRRIDVIFKCGFSDKSSATSNEYRFNPQVGMFTTMAEIMNHP